MQDHSHTPVNEVIHLLRGGNAHVGFDDALKDLPADKRGERPYGLPYSIWQLVEHIRIAQWDMLCFSKDSKHESPKWPDEYWPKETEPASEEAWNHSLQQIKADLGDFVELIRCKDLYSPIPHGTGQNILREALQVADHTAYHVAEIVVLRRLMGCWKS